MRPTRIFIYPMVSIKDNLTGNTYIDDLICSLEQNNFFITNRSDCSKLGVLLIFKYFRNTDYFYFNWIENLSEKKFGLFQTFIFLFQLVLIMFFKKKIIWTLHNLNSHYRTSVFYKLIQKLMLRCSNIIIIHTKETIDFLTANNVKKSKIFYFFHPFNAERKYITSNNGDSDILIWGAMNSYKGIYEFLEFHNKNKLNFTVHVAGRFGDEQYFQKVKSVSSAKVTISNLYISNDDLIRFHKNSLFVLFPYTSESVLNSGSLNYSLMQGAKIIGPNIGAFKELSDLKIINIYRNYFDIEKIVNGDIVLNVDERDMFILNNSWYNFGIELNNMIKSKNSPIF